jgi:DNA polymerase III sliding clamp (beta) subunit (PCNA family)
MAGYTENMRISVKHGLLLDALKSIEILGLASTELSAEQGQLFLAAGDAHQRFLTSCAATVSEPGKVRLKVGILRQLVQELRGELTLEAQPRARTKLTCEAFEATLLDGDHVQALTPVTGSQMRFNPRVFRADVQAVLRIVQDNAALGGLGSVARLSSDGLRYDWVSTDGHRLTRRCHSLEDPHDAGLALVPAKVVRLLSKIAFVGTVTVTISDQSIMVTDSTTSVQFLPSAMKYPDIDRFLPKSASWHIKVARAELYNALAMSASFGDYVDLIASHGELTVSTDGLTTSVAILDSSGGEMPAWRVAASYLRKAVDCDEEQIAIEGNGPMNPVLVVPNPQTIQLVMPMKMS